MRMKKAKTTKWVYNTLNKMHSDKFIILSTNDARGNPLILNPCK